MLDPKYIREHAEEIKQNNTSRRAEIDLDIWITLDTKRLNLLRAMENLRAKRNVVAEKMASASSEDRPPLMDEGRQLKDMVTEAEVSLTSVEAEWKADLLAIPNLTHPDVPHGAGDENNVVLREVGTPISLRNPKDHLALAKQYNLIDFERAAKITGTKFYFLKGKLAILEQALIRYGIEHMVREGYEMLTTPDLAREAVLIGKGFLPRGPETQVYYIDGQDLALIGTSEIPVLGYHMDEILKEEELPKKYVAFSHCFRTESGSYGRESYGLYRVHQFSKVEMFAFVLPEQSEALHLEFLRIEEAFWKNLKIPYRVVDCCTGDLGGSDYRRYDIEAWMWGKNNGKGGYGEVTSCSNCIDYQARGLNIRYASKEGKKGHLHTLNGTVVATPRAMITVLENGQQDDGSIKIPEILVPYCGFDRID